MRYLITYGYLVLLFLLVTLFQKISKVSNEISRKVLHMGIGYTWINLYRFFFLDENVAPFEILLIPISFILLNWFSYHFHVIKIMEREGEKNHPGTIYYAIAMTGILSLTLLDPNFIHPTGIAVACLTFGDGLAAIIGNLFGKYSIKITKEKSLIGTIACFIGSFLGCILLKLYLNLEPLSFSNMLIIAAFAALMELLEKGLDNFSISFGVTFISYLLFYYPNFSFPISTALLLGILISGLAVLLHGLTLSGGIVAFIMIFIARFFGNVSYFLLLCFSYFAIAIVGKIKKKKSEELESSLHKKHGPRDYEQVLVNGIVATIMATLSYFFPEKTIFPILYITAIGEAFADSLASDIGVLSKKNPYNIWTRKPIQKGLSGGISPLGSLSSMIGTLLYLVISYVLFTPSFFYLLVSFVSIMLGVFFDSLLGATLQPKYTCKVCGAITEKTIHCQERTAKVSGLSFLNNDLVNLVSTLFSTLICFVTIVLLEGGIL